MCGVSAEAMVNATGLRASRRRHATPRRRQSVPARGLVVGPQDLRDGLTVPVLLVAPAGQEGRDLGVAVGPGGEQVAQVAGGVPLHVVHVAEAAHGVRVEGVPAEGLEVDVVHLQAPRPLDQGVDIGRHGSSSTHDRLTDVCRRGSGAEEPIRPATSGVGPGRGYPRCVARRSSRSMGGSEEPPDMLKLETASDAALMVAIARMHEPALAEAYRRHGGAVLALSRRVLGSADLAEEVTQEVFVDLWDSPERFDPGRGALRTFLMTKAHGRAVDIVRSESARRQREERTVRETAVSGYDIEHQAWDLAIAEQVKAAVTSLPAEERTAIEMAYFDGHTYREVASILGQPEGTVKSRIRSGLRRLKSALAQHGVETAWTEP